MVTLIVEKSAVMTRDGTPLSVMERPEGLGTFADYHHKVQKYRKLYASILDRQSLDEYLKERKEETARELEQ
jgi:hypothetical protein